MLAKILHFLIYTSMTFFMIIVILRFLLQQAKADFYNPLSQAIVKITRPLLMPLRRIIPGVMGIDMASIALMILLQLAVILVLGLILGQSTLFSFPLYSIAWAILGTLTLVSNIFFWGIIISIVGSWIAPGSNHPVLALVNQLIDPIMAPIRKILPPLGGVIDISPILVLMGLKVLDMVLARAAQAVYLNPNVVIGVW
ncbi:YggT family protein [Cellvibrio polysaccharolyticus]|uniref:YggT family protein n=1 Tax=Cellvibrio polysaccharolyticus TaxID=2082724 RepID=A0A928V1X8_9GAMM|nr:YggT family protein [Cellvibrio polysaccharolyticus]MBE8715640.1 YggT family protein [Cellvibrio polysaccharolyticus]